MKQGIFRIIENISLTPEIYRMKLYGDVSEISAPGQFISLKLDGHFLRRPFSVCDVSRGDTGSPDGVVTIIYKVLGVGTGEMTDFEEGKELDVLTGLGNGYDLSEAGDRPLLIGGGAGIPPLYLAARRLAGENRRITAVLGFNSLSEVYYTGEFKAAGCDVYIATVDGGLGFKGLVTDAFRQLLGRDSFTHFYSCGPLPMLEAVYDEVYVKSGIKGQMSFEERMGCGFGACMGCSIVTKNGYKRICKDGPVLRTEEILWQQ